MSVEVIGLSTTDYPNQEALNKALNIYRTCMRGFIIFHLQKIPGTNVEDVVIDSVSDWRADEIERKLNEGMDIKSIIDIDDFPLLVGGRGLNWKEVFKGPLNDDKDFQNQLWLIKTCRDQSWAHPPEGDADSEGTRAYLFLIAEVLRKIKRPDKQREVETIRDELFFDDSAERLEKAEKDIAEYKRAFTEIEQRLAAAKLESSEYSEKNAALSVQVDEKENQRKKLDRQLKNTKAGNDKLKRDLAGTKRRLEKSEAAQADYKEHCETTDERLKETKSELAIVSGQFSDVKAEKEHIVTRLAAVQDLFTTATLEKPEIRSIFPALDTDSRIRILDRRGTDKRNYLLELLEQKQPAIIYVQSEDMVEALLTRVVSEKESVIKRHGEQTSELEEMEIVKKLENGQLIAVVSNATFSTLAPAHCVEHFVFCHLTPDLDKFFKRCQPAFTSEKNTYLHLIYNDQRDIEYLDEWLYQKYPDRETLNNLYKALKGCVEVNDDFIKSKNLCGKLDMAKLGVTELGIETGLAIFEEVGALERNEDGIKLLSFSGRKSKIHHKGEELKHGIAEVHSFQLEQSIEEIWEKILEKVGVNSEQILRENNINKMGSEVSEIEREVQPTISIEQDRPASLAPDVWPQRTLSAFDSLRQRAAKDTNDTLRVMERHEYELTSAAIEDGENREDYQNKYNFATKFAEEHGVRALEQGITQLITDQNDPAYDFTDDETNMLRAFQEAFWNFRTQSQ